MTTSEKLEAAIKWLGKRVDTGCESRETVGAGSLGG